MRTTADLHESIRDLIVEGRAAWYERRYERARPLLEEALRVASERVDRFGQAAAYHFLGNVAFNECRDDDARRLHSLALELSQEDGDDQGIATSLGSLALIDVADADESAAQARYEAAVDAFERAGMSARAERVRETAHALLVEKAPLEEIVHRTPVRPSGREERDVAMNVQSRPERVTRSGVESALGWRVKSRGGMSV